MITTFIRTLTAILALFNGVLYSQSGTWTWIAGSGVTALGNYGQQGLPSPSNEPPGLYGVANWTDLNGNFWIFGGLSFNNTYEAALWRYDVTSNIWTWMKGPASTMTPSVYGVQGVPAPGNFPGSRGYGCICWTAQNGDLWLFGGNGIDINNVSGDLNDLWRYNISTNEWTWMGGSTSVSSPGNFGSFQVPAPSNWPPARSESTVGWTDGAGNLWMFSGGIHDDVWKYDIANNQWTWMAGSSTPGAVPVYGTLQVSSPLNTPGQRQIYAHWQDAQDNLWIYGGSINGIQFGSDMWMFDMNTYLWTWMAGSSAQPDTIFQFNQQCMPGGRPRQLFENRAYWKDDCGRFWNYAGASTLGYSNELWCFDPTTLQFTWVGGTGTLNVPGNYGTLGVPAPTNYPDPVCGAVAFTDNAGDFWMFGGYTSVPINALWKYQVDPNCPAPRVPNASFTATDTSGCSPFTISLFPSDTTLNNYQWNFNDPASSTDTSSFVFPTYSYLQPGTYSIDLIVGGNDICVSGTDTASLVIVAYSPPIVDLGNDTTWCAEPILYVLDAGNPNAIWIWNTGDTLQNIVVDSEGLYSVVVIDTNNCSSSDSVAISLANFTFLPDMISLCASSTGITLNIESPNAGYMWSTGDTLPSIFVTEPGTYSVTITRDNCQITDSVIVTGFSNSAGLYIPNTFTPDNNGINDVFQPFGEQVTDFHMRIFNRWGQLIFQSDNLSQGWDGTYQGKMAQQDTYVYQISYTVFCDVAAEYYKIGQVNLIR